MDATIEEKQTNQDAPVQAHPEMAETQKPVNFAREGAAKVVKTTLLVAALGGAIIGGGMWWMHMGKVQDTDDAYITGRVHQLSAKVSGTVTLVAVEDNQHVKAGQTLVKIDPRDLQISAESSAAASTKAQWQANEAQSTIIMNESKAEAQKLEAQSQIASAKAQVDRAIAMLSEMKLGVALAKTQIKQREAELTRAASDYDRYKSLVADRAATTQSFEKASQDKSVAEANLEAAKENYRQSLSRVSQGEQAILDARSLVVRAQGASKSADAAFAEAQTSKRTFAMQQAAAKQAQAQYKNALTQLSYTDVIAPVSGKIGHRTVEVGQQIERGQALMSIVSDQKWVVANFKETQLTKMRPGQEVDLKIDAFPNKHFKGIVDSMSPASGAQFAMLPPDNATGNFTKVVQRIAVKVVFDPQSIKGYEDLLSPGMSVVAEVHVAH